MAQSTDINRRRRQAASASKQAGVDSKRARVDSKRAAARSKRMADLAPALIDGETVLDFTTGTVQVIRMGSNTRTGGTIAVTDRRVIIFTKKLGGYDVQDFAYGLLSSVDHKKGMAWGNLNLALAGDRTHVKNVPNEDVERVAQAIRVRMAAAHQHGAPIPPQATPSVADQVRDLARLRDEGLMSTDEFERKRTQLLGL